MEKDLVGDEIAGYPVRVNLDQILEFLRKLKIQERCSSCRYRHTNGSLKLQTGPCKSECIDV